MDWRNRWLLGLAVLGAGGVVLAAHVRAPSPRPPPRDAPSLAGSRLEEAGTHLWWAVAEARADLVEARPRRAHLDLVRADGLIDAVDAALPTTPVRDRIRSAQRDLLYEAPGRVRAEVVATAGALDSVRGLAPVDTVRVRLEAAEQSLAVGNREQADRALGTAAEELRTVEIELPLAAARRGLAEAEAALARSDSAGARHSLAGVEDEVRLVVGIVGSERGAGHHGPT